jgi:iron complex outermembrane receptor protein
MKGKINRVSGFAMLAALGVAAMAGPAVAQDASSDQVPATPPGPSAQGAASVRGGLETVTVSGTKRDEASQDVPIAISAISEQQLANTFRNDVLAVSDMSAGVALGQLAGFRAIAGGIRGTGQNSILVTQDSSVAILVDEFGLNHVQSQFVELFDVERVEVYRGPQGTLFGKNATGGAISIITKRPVLNEFTGDVELQLGMFDSNNGKIAKGKLAINVPVVEDKLAVRLTAIYDYDDGFIKNTHEASGFPNVVPLYGAFGLPVVNPPLPPELNTNARGTGENLNGTDVFAGKFKVLFTPTDNYEAYFIMEVLRDRSDSVPSVNDSPILGAIDPDAGPQFMLMPLLGFDGRDATGESPWVTAVTNQCAGNNPRGLCIPSGHRVSVMGYNLQQTLDLDSVSFKLITAYREQKEILPSTYPGEAFNSLFDATRNLEREQIQIELRAATNFDGPFNFVAGATYQEDNVSMRSFSTVGLSSLLPRTDAQLGRPTNGNPYLDDRGFINLDLDYINDPATGGADQDRTTYAVYLDGSWDVTDRLRLTAGLRWTLDKKDFFRRANPGGVCNQFTPVKDQRLVDTDGNPGTPAVCFDTRSNAISRGGLTAADIDPRRLPLPDEQYNLVVRTNDDWDKITWRGVVDYKVTDEAMVYASYATGFISGGYTETCSSVRTCVPFQPENNWNAELGLKSRWFDNTLQANIALFYTQYSDLIRSQVVPFTDFAGNTTQETINVNAGKSRNIGVEAEFNWQPTDQLRFDLSIAYMDHKYKQFFLDRNGDGDTLDANENLTDYKVPYSPKWKIGGSITYDVILGDAGTLTLNTTGNYQSEAEMSVFNSLNTQMHERFLWDASATWRDAEERYRVTLFAKNILNEKYRIGSNSVAGLWNMTIYGRPRSYGVEVGFHF